MNEQSLFAAALDKRDATERQAFLEQACVGVVVFNGSEGRRR